MCFYYKLQLPKSFERKVYLFYSDLTTLIWKIYSYRICIIVGFNRLHIYIKNTYHRTFKEDRPRFVVIFLAIIEWFSSGENLYTVYYQKKARTHCPGSSLAFIWIALVPQSSSQSLESAVLMRSDHYPRTSLDRVGTLDYF